MADVSAQAHPEAVHLAKSARKFKVVTNIRQASVTDEIGIVCLELQGKRDEIKAAIKWLERNGVNVEPVEIGVIAG